VESALPFAQSIDDLRAERIGEHGLDETAFARTLAATEPALDWLRGQHASGALPLLRLPARQDDLAEIADAAARLSAGASHIVLLGTGGSSLGGQTVAQLAGHGTATSGSGQKPRLHFMDNLDPRSFGELLAELPLSASRFVAVSKSGGTAETLMQTIAAISAVKGAGLEARLPELILGLSEPAKAGKRNGLRDLLAKHRIPLLDHDPGVGGRFSALTNVGLLPAAIAGLDIAALREGAAESLAPILAGADPARVSAAIGAALSVALAEKAKPITVMMAYSDRLERFTRWWVQLWAESLGKDGKGSTPVGALGPVDQHSQLQLFIGGPRDKLFTILTVDTAGTGPTLDGRLANLAGEPDFAGRTMGDLVAAQGRATAETLAKNGCPVRRIHVPSLDERAMGALLMHFMLETIIAARLLGIDAFDQPAVEEGKLLAKKYLAGS
jgi:glucose-6-phosphate isomerase